MSRVRTGVTEKNAEEVYQYFLQAIQERRIFEDDLEKLTKAAQAIVKLTPIRGVNSDVATFKTVLQLWVDTYIPPDKWQRCLDTLRQIQSNQKHGVKSVKLSKKTYAMLKKHAEKHKISLQKALDDAIKWALFHQS